MIRSGERSYGVQKSKLGRHSPSSFSHRSSSGGSFSHKDHNNRSSTSGGRQRRFDIDDFEDERGGARKHQFNYSQNNNSRDNRDNRGYRDSRDNNNYNNNRNNNNFTSTFKRKDR